MAAGETELKDYCFEKLTDGAIIEVFNKLHFLLPRLLETARQRVGTGEEIARNMNAETQLVLVKERFDELMTIQDNFYKLYGERPNHFQVKMKVLQMTLKEVTPGQSPSVEQLEKALAILKEIW